ncbi:MAG TPA: ABC transporter permease [Isosphaeraceae bacterium]|nr:ABC transporter permease [Isosphaeraceae bacterium]
MKYLTYIFRNARRNPVRSLLTIASTSICLFLMMILVSFFAIRDDVLASARIQNRIISISANGFLPAGMMPIARVQEIRQLEGVFAVSQLHWYGGKYQEEILPFAQFGVDPDSVFTVLSELTIPADQLRAFQETKNGCVVGRKLAEDKGFTIGDSLPLKGDLYPVSLDLKICGIYDGPSHRNLRMCLFNWEYLDEGLKRTASRTSSASLPSSGRGSGNAGMIYIKCKNSDVMAGVCKTIDDLYRNSDFPTRTLVEEAFGKVVEEMLGDMKGMIRAIGLAVVFSLLCVAGNAMAMSMRERTSELAVLKAIGFTKGRVLFLVLTESVLVAGLGGALGSLGCKGLFELVDISKYTAGFLPVFFIPWNVALQGLAVSLFVGFASGFVPAVRAANLSVVDGLRRVV